MSRPPSWIRILRGAGVLPAFVMSLALATSAQAVLVPLAADLDGPQAGTTSPAVGAAALVFFDDATDQVFWTINFTEATLFGGLGSVTSAHFHGPALPGAAAPIRLKIAPEFSALGAPMVGLAAIDAEGTGASIATLKSELLGGLWYINIHTTAFTDDSGTFGGGEIRGQVTVVPEPSSLALSTLACAGMLVTGWRARRRSPKTL